MKNLLVEAKDEKDWPLLEGAVRKGDIETAEYLINIGADIHNYTRNGALVQAVYGGHKKAVELLLSKGVDINCSKENLIFCLINGKLSQSLERSGIIKSQVINQHEHAHRDVMELLINKGVNVNYVCPGEDENDDQLSLLHYSCQYGFIDFVKLLVKAGVNLEVKDSKGFTPLHISLGGNICTPNETHKEVIKFLLDNGADINAKTNRGDTVLFIAVIKGNKDIIELLINKGANLELGDKSTPLFTAAYNNNLEIASLLIDRGANIDIKSSGITPLITAALEGHTDMVKLLIDRGADLNVSTPEGLTALIAAEGEGHIITANLLKSYNKDHSLNKNKKITYKKSPILAAILSFFIVGLGQFYNGDTKKGITFLLIGIVGSLFTFGILWLIMAIISIVDAILVANKTWPTWE
ncbi:MAG: ankyrin repeat domain-containing protein [Candidatus Eremiobacterota bacterium]